MSNLHDAVLELIETQSLNPNDYESQWSMYDDANDDTQIDMLMDEHLYKTRDELVKWVCNGYLEYLDSACDEAWGGNRSEGSELRLLQDAHMMYLQYVAYNAVAAVFHNE